LIVILLVTGILSCALVGGYRALALRRNWLDHPNRRSSHRATVPRGAGIVFAMIITGVALLMQPAMSAASFVLIFIVAGVGWWDDLCGLSARVRFALYGLSAVAVALTICPLLSNRPGELALVMLVIPLALVWLTNLYNFMDGINGIAGFEALFVLGAVLGLGAGTPFNAQFDTVVAVALTAVGGFLLWNFPRAHVFMGDAGSAYLGALMGLLMLWSLLLDGPSTYSWLILLALFIVDTGYTLAIRILTGQRWYAAHRLHSYQRLSDRLHSHTRTVQILMGTNIVWLLPWAWLARDGGWTGAYAMTAAYAPLLAACYRLKAGVPARTAV
jgi:Fuc2NAc and GlcNAc transferase